MVRCIIRRHKCPVRKPNDMKRARTLISQYIGALMKIDRLTTENDRLRRKVDEYKSRDEDEDDDDDWYGDDNEEFEDLDVVIFLRDIGFDPDNLPSSVGERMAIRDLLQAAKAVR